MSFKKRTKFEMVLTVSVALLAVVSVGVSTFAWFQAQVDVNIDATSDTTNITVNKPDDYSFWAYNGNGDDDYDQDGAFNNDFTQITSGSSLTSLAGLGPGQKMLFAVKFDNVTSLTFAIKTITSNNSTKQPLTAKRKVAGSNPERLINIGWAINIYITDGTAGTEYTSFLTSPGTDKFQVADQSDANSWNVNSGTALAPTITYGTAKTIFTKPNATVRETYYIYYIVEFEDNKTNYYKEVSADSAGASTLDHPTAGAANRWFVKYTSGETTDYNSNCFAGLKFAINEIVVTKNGETVDQG